jgi:hypothetical protein
VAYQKSAEGINTLASQSKSLNQDKYHNPMKSTKSFFVLVLAMTFSLAQGQDYAFKVLANKGVNEVKSGDSWQPLKTGASLKAGDELKIADNAYLGLVHVSGKPMEVKQSGNYKVADLAAKVSGGILS